MRAIGPTTYQYVVKDHHSRTYTDTASEKTNRIHISRRPLGLQRNAPFPTAAFHAEADAPVDPCRSPCAVVCTSDCCDLALRAFTALR